MFLNILRITEVKEMNTEMKKSKLMEFFDLLFLLITGYAS